MTSIENIEIRPVKTSLAALNWFELAEAFATVYAGYQAPFPFDAVTLRSHVEGNSIVTRASPLWREGDGVVALAALGVRGPYAWIGGFGIAASYRGRGLACVLLEEAVELAREQGAQRISLEVPAGNLPSIRTCERIGFEKQNEVALFERPADAALTAIAADADVQEAEAYALLGRALEPAVSTWQTAFGSLRRLERLEALVAGPSYRPHAYAFFRREPGLISLFVASGDPVRLAEILATLVRSADRAPIRAINVPPSSETAEVLRRYGFVERARHFVMQRKLDLEENSTPKATRECERARSRSC